MNSITHTFAISSTWLTKPKRINAYAALQGLENMRWRRRWVFNTAIVPSIDFFQECKPKLQTFIWVLLSWVLLTAALQLQSTNPINLIFVKLVVFTHVFFPAARYRGPFQRLSVVFVLFLLWCEIWIISSKCLVQYHVWICRSHHWCIGHVHAFITWSLNMSATHTWIGKHLVNEESARIVRHVAVCKLNILLHNNAYIYMWNYLLYMEDWNRNKVKQPTTTHALKYQGVRRKREAG